MQNFISTNATNSLAIAGEKTQTMLNKVLELIGVSEREAKDAARLAVQSSLAAASMFLLMQSTGLPEKFVGVLSAVLVVQPSAGNTLGEARDRVLATVVGSFIGLISLLLLPVGYGTAAALALSMLIMNGIAGLRPDWRYGAVAAVALSLGAESNALETAQDRALAIGIGVVVGTAISFIVWPDTSEKRVRRHLQAALQGVANFLQQAVENADAETSSDKGKDDDADRYHSNIKSAREAANGIKFADREPALKQIEMVEELYNAILILNRVAEETDHVSKGDDDLQENIRLTRKYGCELIEAIAKGDYSQDDKLKDIWESLGTVRKQVSANQDDARGHVIRNAFVFGLGEVADGLQNLMEGRRRKQRT